MNKELMLVAVLALVMVAAAPVMAQVNNACRGLLRLERSL